MKKKSDSNAKILKEKYEKFLQSPVWLSRLEERDRLIIINFLEEQSGLQLELSCMLSTQTLEAAKRKKYEDVGLYNRLSGEASERYFALRNLQKILMKEQGALMPDLSVINREN